MSNRNQEILDLVFNALGDMIREQIKKNPNRVLNVICLSDDPASASYVKNKQKVCEEYGVKFKLHKPAEKWELDELMSVLERDENNRVIIQWPFDEGYWGSRQEVMGMIPKYQDVDGFHWSNLDTVTTNGLEAMLFHPTFSPTAKFALYLAHTIENIKGNASGLESKEVVVIGQGLTSGLPVAVMAEKLGASVSWVNSKTSYMFKQTAVKYADIIISCAGVPNIINGRGLYSSKDDAVYINIGMARWEGKMTGDIDYDSIENLLSNTYFVNPLFKSTGKGTCMCLLFNTVL